MLVAKVLVDVRPLDEPYDYTIPPDMPAQVGSLVRVDFAGRSVRGWVVDVVTDAADSDLKPLRRLLSGVPVADATTLALARWCAQEYAGACATILDWATPEPLPRAHRDAPVAPSPSRRARVPVLTDEIESGRHVDAFVRTWPSDDGAATVTALCDALAPGRCALVVAPPAWAPTLTGAVDLSGPKGPAATRMWEVATGGGARIVVAGRHGPFVPVPNLGLVVVVAAHSDTHKDEQAPTLDARVVARELARLRSVPFVVLAATEPVGVEGLRASSAAAGTQVHELAVPGHTAHWPLVEVVDMREEPPGTGPLSARLFSAVREAHRTGGRTLVFLNRTGTARALVCRACGTLADCPECTSVLRPDGTSLHCPRCAWTAAEAACRVCGSHRMRRLGIGVDRLRTELGAALAGVQVLVASGRHAPWPERGGVVVGTRAAFRHRGEFDLVVLVDPDATIGRSGLRAEEAAFGLLVDAVACARGRRAGGRVVVQTRRPASPAVAALAGADPAAFEDHLLGARRPARLPPFRRLLAVSSADDAPVAEAASALAALGCEVLGPRRDGKSDLLALVEAGTWTRATAAARAVALAHRPVRVRIEADPLDPR